MQQWQKFGFIHWVTIDCESFEKANVPIIIPSSLTLWTTTSFLKYNFPQIKLFESLISNLASQYLFLRGKLNTPNILVSKCLWQLQQIPNKKILQERSFSLKASQDQTKLNSAALISQACCEFLFIYLHCDWPRHKPNKGDSNILNSKLNH